MEENMVYFVKCYDGRIIIVKVADLSQKGKMILSIAGKLYIGHAKDIKVSPYQFYEGQTKYLDMVDLIPYRHKMKNNTVSFCDTVTSYIYAI